MASRKSNSIYNRIRQILESARASVARSVNTTQVVANWLVGREIVEDEQRGRRKAGYGQQLIVRLSGKLERDFGNGYSTTNLKLFRQFFLTYPSLLTNRIGHTLRDQWAPAETGLPSVEERFPMRRELKTAKKTDRTGRTWVETTFPTRRELKVQVRERCPRSARNANTIFHRSFTRIKNWVLT
ncbi:MAG: DUF1016 N-terminal domain-containing protein [Candidatus Binatia bacterium]